VRGCCIRGVGEGLLYKGAEGERLVYGGGAKGCCVREGEAIGLLYKGRGKARGCCMGRGSR
jgi:hypothetical protein